MQWRQKLRHVYPRTRKQPEAETYRWFVENERIEDGSAKYGLALHHALETDQRLPLLPADPETPDVTARCHPGKPSRAAHR